MTKDEVKEAATKFTDYLAANGVKVLCHAMYIDTGPTGEIYIAGDEGMLTEMLLIVVAGNHGLEVVPK